ncbi:GNAT family N-acetyltransferase [Companilactobacillus huachuanensis]|uniref:GNAT family N-acetyltransferase n=1 Tax=Companilactobacillus huachuanensis TaxID=2559914 RepID=A0ABW1RPW6_9LACO|nr:GNAT family N-acetyltransferase [Companilactobacillus huachuanensis]
MTLIGRNVIIRNFEMSDLEQFLELVQDKNNHELAGLEYTEDVNFGRDLLDMYRRRDGSYTIALAGNNKMIGIIELNKRGESTELLLTREMGFVIDRKFRHQGYAKEAVGLMINYGFKNLQLTEIWASTEKDNPIPQGLLEKLDFKYIYEADQALPYTGQHNLVKYYLLKK